MSAEPHESGPIQNFIASLYSGRFYGVAPGLGVGAGARNLLILVTLLAFVTSMRLSMTVGTMFDAWRDGVVGGRVPILHIEKGRLRVEGPQPYVGLGSNGLMAIVDTTGRYVTLPDSVTGGIFLGKASGLYRSWGKTLQPIPYNFEGAGFHLDAAGVSGLRRTAIPLAILLGWAVLTFYFLAANAVVVFLLAGPAWWSAKRVRPDVRYRHVLTLACFVVTPFALLLLGIGLISPQLALGGWLLYPMAAGWSLMFGLRRWLLPPPEPGGPR